MSVKLTESNSAKTTRASVSAAVNRGITPAPPLAPSPAGSIPPHGPDAVDVSDRASTTELLAARLADLPDVRCERVWPLSALVESGAYHPAAGEVADAIIRDEK